METAPTRDTSRRWVIVGVLAGIAILGYAAGAYLRWTFWFTMDTIITWFLIVVIVVAGAILVLIPRRLTRLAGAALLVFGLAAAVAQFIGPSRPELLDRYGELTLTTTSPMPGEASIEAWCRSDAAGTEMTLSGDINMRLDVWDDGEELLDGIDENEFVGVFIETGDRWRRNSRYSRADNLFLTIIVSPVLASQGEVRLVATDASDLELEWTPAGGTLRFAGLQTISEDPEIQPEPVDMAGTVTWTCDA